MTNHPNRNKHNRLVPTKEAVFGARTRAGQTQSEAAALVYVGLRAWQMWEAGDRPMPAAAWELYRLKVGEKKLELADER